MMVKIVERVTIIFVFEVFCFMFHIFDVFAAVYLIVTLLLLRHDVNHTNLQLTPKPTTQSKRQRHPIMIKTTILILHNIFLQYAISENPNPISPYKQVSEHIPELRKKLLPQLNTQTDVKRFFRQ